MLSFRFVVTAAIAASVSTIVSTAAFAAKSDSTLADVVVTATRTPTPVDEVLASVTVITRDEIERTAVAEDRKSVV